jgi:hypothetical protein
MMSGNLFKIRQLCLILNYNFLNKESISFVLPKKGKGSYNRKTKHKKNDNHFDYHSFYL